MSGGDGVGNGDVSGGDVVGAGGLLDDGDAVGREAWGGEALGRGEARRGGAPEESSAVVAGVGCRAACPAEAVVAVVRRAEALAGCAASVLAVPERREAVGCAAARALGVGLVLVSAARMIEVQARCPTRSARALAAVGVASVAEGAALAAGGPGAVLLLARVGEGWATCAMARGVGA